VAESSTATDQDRPTCSLRVGKVSFSRDDLIQERCARSSMKIVRVEARGAAKGRLHHEHHGLHRPWDRAWKVDPTKVKDLEEGRRSGLSPLF